MNRRGFMLMGAAAAIAPALPPLPVKQSTILMFDIETYGSQAEFYAYAFNTGKISREWMVNREVTVALAKACEYVDKCYSFPDRPVTPTVPLAFDDSDMEVIDDLG